MHCQLLETVCPFSVVLALALIFLFPLPLYPFLCFLQDREHRDHLQIFPRLIHDQGKGYGLWNPVVALLDPKKEPFINVSVEVSFVVH